jgi:hypothetical protein
MKESNTAAPPCPPPTAPAPVDLTKEIEAIRAYIGRSKLYYLEDGKKNREEILEMAQWGLSRIQHYTRPSIGEAAPTAPQASEAAMAELKTNHAKDQSRMAALDERWPRTEIDLEMVLCILCGFREKALERMDDPIYRDNAILFAEAIDAVDRMLARGMKFKTAIPVSMPTFHSVEEGVRTSFYRLRAYLENSPCSEVNLENMGHLNTLRSAIPNGESIG